MTQERTPAPKLPDHDNGSHTRWWVTADRERDQYEIRIVRYSVEDGRTTWTSAYVGRDADGNPPWLTITPGSEIPPAYVIPGEVLHIMRAPFVDRTAIGEWLQGIVQEILFGIATMPLPSAEPADDYVGGA